MRTWTQVAGVVRVGAVLCLTAIAGCTISIQPWTKPQPPPTAPQGQDPTNPNNMMMKNGSSPQNVAANNEEFQRLISKLNDEVETRKAMQDQVVTLKRQLKDREENLRTASYEMDESSKQIKRTRDEFRIWQSEMDELRERIRKLEDYRSSAKPLIDDIYRYLDREKEAPRPFKYTPPKQ